MFGTSAADSQRIGPLSPCRFRAARHGHETPTERYDEIHVTHPTPRARVASGVARDGAPLSRRDETSFPRVRSIARIPRLGVAAEPLSWVCRYAGLPMYPAPSVAADGYARNRTTFDQACERELAAAPLSAPALGDMLRHALGLSAWKRFGSAWSLRVNPSSGNLHPTEVRDLRSAAGPVDQPAVPLRGGSSRDRIALRLRRGRGARRSPDDRTDCWSR